jgi:hypothetical protein
VDTHYFERMTDLLQLGNDLTKKRGLNLILTPDRAHQTKTQLIAHLILVTPLFVISGDEWLPAFSLPRLIRQQTTQIKPILSRLTTARASTCYRLLDSLSSIAPAGEPILVLEFLHTFYDDDIPLRTRLFKLRDCCRELKRLSLHRPVIVMSRATQTEDFEKFLPALDSIADRTFTLEPEFEPVTQPRLF